MQVSRKLIENVGELKKALNEISVYDFDVYTSMELYYKIANKLNEVIKELMRFEGLVSDEVIKQNEKLIYLLGEGLNIEVVKKINQMVADGTMDTIINHNVFNSLNNKVENYKEELSSQIKEKATKQEVDIERKRIDSFVSLSEGSTTGDAEIIDARIGADGVIYNNLGTAIRTQLENKEDKPKIVNLNNDLLFNKIDENSCWLLKNIATHNVSDGVLTFTQSSDDAGIFLLNIKMKKGHKYFYYIDVESNSQAVQVNVGGYGAKYNIKNNYIENIFEWTVDDMTTSLKIFNNTNDTSYEVSIKNLYFIDLTDCNIYSSELTIKDIRDYILAGNTKPVNYNSIYDIKKGRYNEIEVKDFGAIGDGITDDTDAISNAISNLKENGVLKFTTGIYLVKDISVKSNITIQGEPGAKIKLADYTNNPNYNCITVNNVSNVIIKDIELDGNRLKNKSTANNADSGWNGIHIISSQNIIIDNIKSHSNGYHGCIMVNVDNITIKNSEFYDNGYRPFHGHHGVRNCKFYNNKCYQNGNGFAGESGGGTSLGNGFDAIFFFSGIENVDIKNNYIHSGHSLACIQVAGDLLSNGETSKNIRICENICDGHDEIKGIQIMGTGISNVNISNNTITNCTDGILLNSDVDGENTDFIIKGNIIDDTMFGIRCVKKYSDLIVNDNVVKNVSQFGIYLITADRATINANIVKDCQFGIVLQESQNIKVISNSVNKVNKSDMLWGIKADGTNTNIYMTLNDSNIGILNNSINGIEENNIKISNS